MKKQLVLALALAAAPFAASAGGHSYTYLEGGYAQLNQDLPQQEFFEIDDIEAGGFFVGGSAALGETFYLFGSYRDGDDDLGVSVPFEGEIGSAGVDMNQFNFGLGYHHSLNQRTDLRDRGELPQHRDRGRRRSGKDATTATTSALPSACAT